MVSPGGGVRRERQLRPGGVEAEVVRPRLQNHGKGVCLFDKRRARRLNIRRSHHPDQRGYVVTHPAHLLHGGPRGLEHDRSGNLQYRHLVLGDLVVVRQQREPLAQRLSHQYPVEGQGYGSTRGGRSLIGRLTLVTALPTLLLIALVTFGLMVASVVAAAMAGRPVDDRLRLLRRQKYDESSLAAVDVVSTRPPLDVEAFRLRAENDPRIMLLLVTDFLAEVPDLTRQIRVALDLGDSKELARTAASLRDRARVLSADAFARSVDQLEEAARIDITLAWRAADVFDRDLDRLTAALERLRRDLTPAAPP